tara:strand:- start:1262 stop:1792 length:531 start_codon:yes stop_codon:yes gene_type:complete
MTARLFESVTYEAEKCPTITTPTIFNGMPPFAYALGEADDWTGYVMYKGPANTVLSGNVIGRNTFMGAETDAASVVVRVVPPEFATHVQIGVLASGNGDVTVTYAGSPYVIPVAIPETSGGTGPIVQSLLFGPNNDNGIAIGSTSGSLFMGFSFSVPAGVLVSAIVFRWYRRSSTL